MTSQKINPRVKQILLQLCSAEGYVTLAGIAEKINVSAKTVTRDLPVAQDILRSLGFTLAKKTGTGLKLLASEEEKAHLAARLAEQATETIYTPAQRLCIITETLLENQDSVKLFEFTRKLKVAESTVSNDLDKLEPWFKKQRLQLVRKPGLGIYLQGDEQDIRKTTLQFIYENTDENLIFRILRGKSSNPITCNKNNAAELSKLLLNLIDAAVIAKLKAILQETGQFEEKNLSDSAYIGLILHLALSVARIKKAEHIKVTPALLDKLQTKKEYGIARRLAEKISESFAIQVPDGETAYIAMHLLGARNQYADADAQKNIIDNFQLVKLAADMIKFAERETGVSLAKNNKLLVGLVNHLGPSISRLKMNLEIRNPLLNEMKSYYPELMYISKKCARLLTEKLGLELPEAEVAFIAMHLGAAIESQHKIFKPIYKIAVACPAGIGSSQLLATKIQKEYDNLNVTDIISAIHINETKLQQKGVRFIISTIAIPHCALPVITVNSFLSETDKITIANQINVLNKAEELHPPGQQADYTLVEKLSILTSYSQAVLEILQNFFLRQGARAASIGELIKACLTGLKAPSAEPEKLTAALLSRHRQGATVLSGQGLILLHCRTQTVSQLHFGVIQLKDTFPLAVDAAPPEQIKTAVLMLAPSNVDPHKLETISYLAKMLIERWGFMELLHGGSQDLVLLELNNLLEEFFKEKNTTLMEG